MAEHSIKIDVSEKHSDTLRKFAERHMELQRATVSWIAAALGVLVSAVTTVSSFEVLSQGPTQRIAIGVVVAAMLILGVFTVLAERRQAGSKPLAGVAGQVTSAFIAGLEASSLNPTKPRETHHE